jgi:serine/threonine protein kinase
MTPERWQRVEDLFGAAKELDPAHIESYLRSQCGGDRELEQEVASLLLHDGLAITLLGEQRKPWEGLLRDAADATQGTAMLPTEAGTVKTDRLPVPLLSEGMKVGPYRILNKLGEGGMGIVYRANDERLDRVVALKTLRGTAIDETAERRMWREARVAASLNHPGVCRLYDVGDCHGRIYLVMELLEGEPLSRAIARESMDLPQAIETMLGVLDALEALHEKALVHRDLKPSNIFLTPHGVKLLDFGLSRTAATVAGGAQGDTHLAPMAGTPFYVSPEQMEGHEPDARSDLFAAGIIFVELLGGKRAFAATGTFQTLHRSIADTAPALEGFQGSAVEEIIRKALAGNPERRYQSARSMAEDLRSVRAGQRAAQIPETRVKRLIALPFRMLRPDSDFEFLSFSLPDALTNSLSALSSLVVRSSASASRYTAPSPDLKAIAAEAEVDFAITGTLLRSGDQLRVATQLADAPTGAVIWSQTSQLGIHDIFQLQDELVRRVVESLALPLTGRDTWLLAHDVPASPLAYE